MIRWITKDLGTGQFTSVEKARGIKIVDVRPLLDSWGNNVLLVRELIHDACKLLSEGHRVVICCDHGISRSNSVAAGVLALSRNIPFDNATREVVSKTGEKSLKIEVLAVVRNAILSEENLIRNNVKNKARKILVTGGTGFIGSSLVPYLRANHAVTAPSRQEIDLLEGAVSLDQIVRVEGITDILYLAAPRVMNTNESFGKALTMLRNTLDVCRANSTKLIFLSSFEVFSGYRSLELIAPENLPPLPKGLIGELSYLCELLILRYCKQYEIEFALIRSSTVYAPKGDKPRFINNFLQKATLGKDIIIHKYLNGFPRLDLLHIDDFCSAMNHALQRNVTDVMHIGSGEAVAVKDIAEKIVKRKRAKAKITPYNVDDYRSNTVMDISKALKTLGWRPMINIQEGIEKVIDAS